MTDALRSVIDPELRQSIVELGMVRSIDIHEDGRVDVIVSLTTPGCPIRCHFEQAVADNVGADRGRDRASASASTSSPTPRSPDLQQKLGRPAGCPRARSPRSRT